MRLTSLVAATVLLLAPASLLAEASAFKVVAHPAAPADSLTREQLSRMFLKKITRWPSGEAAVVVDHLPTSKVREAFSTEVHGKSLSAVRSYWNQQIFAGREVPPVEKASDEEVLAFVKATPRAIGYVSSTASTAGVKVIEIKP